MVTGNKTQTLLRFDVLSTGSALVREDRLSSLLLLCREVSGGGLARGQEHVNKSKQD